MTCRKVDLGNGAWIISCTRGEQRARCKVCRGSAGLLCDWKLKGPKAGKTCDAPLCERCAQSPAPDKHLCPAHWRVWEAHPANATKDQQHGG